jgi:transcription antitermination factor NusG
METLLYSCRKGVTSGLEPSEGGSLFEGVEALEQEIAIQSGTEYVYCIYCQPQKQVLIARQIPKFFNCKAFNPIIIKRLWTGKQYRNQTYSLMPGYVFLFSSERIDPFVVRRLEGVEKIMQYGNGDYALSEEDERLARWLLRYDGTIGLSRAVKVGDRVHVVQGPLSDFAGTIIRMDLRRKRALINLSLHNNVWPTWMDYDFFEMTS